MSRHQLCVLAKKNNWVCCVVIGEEWERVVYVVWTRDELVSIPSTVKNVDHPTGIRKFFLESSLLSNSHK